MGYGGKREGGDGGPARKYNPYHADDGRFDFAPTGAAESESVFVPTAGRGPSKPPAPKAPAPKPPAAAKPAEPPKTTNDVLLPAGKEVGTRNPGAGDNIRTVTPTEFDRIQADILNGSKPIATPGQYNGQWYERPDGTQIGIRQSSSGPTIEVNKSDNPVLKPGYKVHRK